MIQEIRDYFNNNESARRFVETSSAKETNKQALWNVCSGDTYTDAARKVGLSKDRVRIACFTLYRKSQEHSDGDWMQRAGFSERAINCLSNSIGWVDGHDGSEDSLRKLLKTNDGYKDLSEIPNMGRKTMADILSKMGIDAHKA